MSLNTNALHTTIYDIPKYSCCSSCAEETVVDYSRAIPAQVCSWCGNTENLVAAVQSPIVSIPVSISPKPSKRQMAQLRKFQNKVERLKTDSRKLWDRFSKVVYPYYYCSSKLRSQWSEMYSYERLLVEWATRIGAHAAAFNDLRYTKRILDEYPYYISKMQGCLDCMKAILQQLDIDWGGDRQFLVDGAVSKSKS